MGFENPEISEELMRRAKECTSPEEILALAKEEGYELTDEQLTGVAGGWCAAHCYMDTCPPDAGDAREGIDESLVRAAFMSGEDLGY